MKIYKEKYMVSKNGDIYKITKNGLKIKSKSNRNGYEATSINRKPEYVHLIVAKCFLGEPNGRVVDHLNMDRKDNRLENLEYVTQKENVRRATEKIGYNSGAKAQEIKVIYEGRVFDSYAKLALHLGVHKTCVRQAVKYGYKLKCEEVAKW